MSVRVLTLIVVLLGVVQARAANTNYLTIPGVQGEVATAANRGAIEILTYSFGGEDLRTAAGEAAGKATLTDFTFTKNTDSTSPALFAAMGTGKAFASVTLQVYGSTSKSASAPTFTITMANVFVTSISESGSQDGVSESVSLSYGKINWTYSSTTATGATTTPQTVSWDLSTNQVALNP